MIAEDYNFEYKPNTSIPKGRTINFIIDIIKEVPTSFISALDNPKLIKPLNENKLTQILVEQINAILREKDLSILAQNQYSDLFYGTKGIPDFYFHVLEKGKTTKPLLVVESKRLPNPNKNEAEYVKGKNKNGGIERFKIEKHGKCFDVAGIVGFIEEHNFDYWTAKINKWIIDLANNNTFWKQDEKLTEIERDSCSYLISVAHKVSDTDIKLYHFWIKI